MILLLQVRLLPLGCLLHPRLPAHPPEPLHQRVSVSQEPLGQREQPILEMPSAHREAFERCYFNLILRNSDLVTGIF